uniref:Transposase MuDR plant domain-containing protein n=1 Tax=Arundo donax TaxID=35708 RepID=A0A0A9FWI1_ARUDO
MRTKYWALHNSTRVCVSQNGHQFRRAMKSYHIMNERDYRYIRNVGDRVKANYEEDRCPFFIHASRIAGESTFQIRKRVVSLEQVLEWIVCG